MSAIAHQPHPVTRALAGVRDQLAQVADAAVWSMDATETTAALDDVLGAEAQLAGLKARLLTHAERTDVAGDTAASSTANWHAVATRTTRPSAHRSMRLADGLEQHELTRAALAAGDLRVEQAEVILRALSELPDTLDPDVSVEAEQQLLDLAADHDARALRVLGRRILEVVSPETADAHEAQLLEKEERAAQIATRLTMYDDGHGKVHGKFSIDSLTGAMFKKALFAIASPKHQASKGPLQGPRPTPERLGQAFVELIERYPAKRLPSTGGLDATAVVLIPLETLRGELKAAHLDTGEPIAPGTARRLACEAKILPAVLGTRSEVLDLGRSKRLYQPPQRFKALIEHRGCAIEGCDRPGTHMHHPTAWSEGGPTNSDGIPLCPWDHRRAHDQRYNMTRLPTGKYTFHMRT